MQKKKKMNRLLIATFKITAILPALLTFKWKVYYKNKSVQGKKLPKSAILMSNHTSLMDFAIWVLFFFSRTIRIWMGEVLFTKNKILTWFLYKMGGIFVDRNSAQIDFLSESIETLDNGGIVGVFPEGQLPVNGKPFPFKPGIVFLALNTDAPIIPIYTDGAMNLFKRTKVVIGEPINIRDYCKSKNPSQDEIKELTSLLQKKTYELKDVISDAQKNKKKPKFFKIFDITKLFMDLGRFLFIFFSEIIFRVRTYDVNGKRFRKFVKGGAIIAGNHSGFRDPLVLGVAFFYRRSRFLTSEAVMRNPLLNFLMKNLGCIRIDRNISDIESIKKCIDVLKDDNLLIMFPQGRIERDNDVEAIKSGATLMALRANVPIIPAYISKKKHWYNTQKIVIGEPLNIKDYSTGKIPSMKDINNFSNILLQKMEECESVFKKDQKDEEK
jgi:1-acyl-sn-glycerol-3-phosphate acyltransferase